MRLNSITVCPGPCDASSIAPHPPAQRLHGRRSDPVRVLVGMLRDRGHPTPRCVAVEAPIGQAALDSDRYPAGGLIGSLRQVIMRLLEFPAVVIDCPSKDDVADRLADRNLAWGLGKNCLFSVPERSLSSMLSRAPMYIMLVDLDDNGLQGTAAVDLSGYADGPAIVGKRGFRRGRVPLVDLMGNRVAFIDIGGRIGRAGCHLVGH